MVGQKTGLAYHPRDEITSFYAKKLSQESAAVKIYCTERTLWNVFPPMATRTFPVEFLSSKVKTPSKL